ncbi:hypothetical protein [Aerococcus sp. UMB7834]|uniref:hypothetical protein n=1 Tax=Aerococcus sp. UMB7834 TaxID=3046342 RepID=UPI00254E503F|nr:hypothetical protein [Aerococcus sp. UMB7834]MDK6804285.1 hypothetical protein [Aerococcus sp. UMB7834]
MRISSTTQTNFIAVIDGESAKSSICFDGQAPGKLAAQMIQQVLADLHPRASWDHFIQEVNLSIQDYYALKQTDPKLKAVGLQAVAVVYSRQRQEIWLIGDCQALVGGQHYSQPRPADQILAHMRRLIAYTEMRIDHKAPDSYFAQEDSAHLQVLPWLVRTSEFANRTDTPYGYAVLNGDPIPADLIQIIPVDGKDSVEIVLASNGYPELAPSLEASESQLQALLAQDPHLINQYIATRGQGQFASFDDRAYVRFRV